LNANVIAQRPRGKSPRFQCYPEYFSSIRSALDRVGHVILEDVLNETTLNQISQYSGSIFKGKDACYQRGEMTDSEIYTHHGGTYGFFQPDLNTATHHLEKFMSMIGRSRVLDLYFHLLGGNVAALHGPMLRRVRPLLSTAIGFHVDTQVIEYAKQAFNSNDSYTMWMPFCDINETVPALLLLSRQFDFKNLDPSVMAPLNLKNEYLEATPESNRRTYTALNSLISTLDEDIYAPLLKKGSVVIFKSDVLHGSFTHDGFKKERYSADIRFVGEFDPEGDYSFKERAFLFSKYQRRLYGAFDKNEAAQLEQYVVDIVRTQLSESRLHNKLIRRAKKSLKNVLRKVGLRNE